MNSVHFIGVGGIGMTSLAGLFSEAGWSVRGSDQKVYPPASTELARLGVRLLQGFSADHLKPKPDLVIVGNVVSRGNEEVEALLRSDLTYTSMAQALMKYFMSKRRRIVVAGTHGKTTTASLLTWILTGAGQDPGMFVGGIPTNFGRGYAFGCAEGPFVVEGDEYDTAFFEKTPKFLHYNADDLILTSIDFDHADIYRDLSHVMEQFQALLRQVPKDRGVVANMEASSVRLALNEKDAPPVVGYGFTEEATWRATDISQTADQCMFRVLREGKLHGQVCSPLRGHHNVLNALACLAMADRLGVSMKDALEAVRGFRGIARRQQLLGVVDGIRLYDDFAHHPVAIQETLRAFRPLADEEQGKLWAVFEPRSNTVRRRIFEDDLPKSFGEADETILAPVFQKQDALRKNDQLQPEEVVERIQQSGRDAWAAASYEEIVERIVHEVRSGDVVVFMSNGNFGGVPQSVKAALESR